MALRRFRATLEFPFGARRFFSLSSLSLSLSFSHARSRGPLCRRRIYEIRASDFFSRNSCILLRRDRRVVATALRSKTDMNDGIIGAVRSNEDVKWKGRKIFPPSRRMRKGIAALLISRGSRHTVTT